MLNNKVDGRDNFDKKRFEKIVFKISLVQHQSLILILISEIFYKERKRERERDRECKRRENVLLTPMSLLESTREIELAFLVTPLCATANELAVSGVERSFTKCLLSIAREVEVLDSRRETRSPGRDPSIFSRYTGERSPRFSWTLVLLILLFSPDFYARYLSQE